MMKIAFAAAAVLGAVMVAPAQATVPAESSVMNFLFPATMAGFAAQQSLYTAWLAAWDPYFSSAAVVTLTPSGSVAQYSSFPDVRNFTTLFSPSGGFAGSYTMPVPGPIAGAGLPLLAAGIAFAAWRRRRAANAA